MAAVAAMTLITYPTRVHFADHVLEEALHSELERAGLFAPLLLGDAPLATSETCERIRTGLHNRRIGLSWALPATANLAEAARQVEVMAAGRRVDVVIAFGSSRAIELGQKLRRSLSGKVGYRLPLYAVPGVDGLPGPCNPHLESWRSSLPTVLICDPTLTVGADFKAMHCSVVLSLVRATEAWLAEAYNPPADGMALDAFRRCLDLLPRIGARADLAVGRDLMAAALNAALSQDKGVGPAQVLAAALQHANDAIDAAAAARLILPVAIEAMNPAREKSDVLGRLMGGRWSAEQLRQLMGQGHGPPRPDRLSDLGVSRQHLDEAVAEVERGHLLPAGVGRAMLEAVF
jgi:alcohol dehydrogenase class IV